MTSLQIIFLIAAAVVLFSAVMVVTRRNMVHAALFLVLSLFGVAILFVLLEAGFLAVIQILVYIGAIAILMIFGIMLTRDPASEDKPAFNKGWAWALFVAAFTLEGFILVYAGWPGSGSLASEALSSDPVTDLGLVVLSENGYVIATMAAGMLLLAAMIGAIAVAWQAHHAEGGEA